jgi:hypothetical protein
MLAGWMLLALVAAAPATLPEGRFEVDYAGMSPRVKTRGSFPCQLRTESLVCKHARWVKQKSWAKSPYQDLEIVGRVVTAVNVVDGWVEIVTPSRTVRLRPVVAPGEAARDWAGEVSAWARLTSTTP